MNSLLLLNRKRKYSGFSLVEVIIAASMTMVVVTIAGIGVAAMTRSNIKSDLESNIQTTTNMAMEFIAGEARASHSVETDVSKVSSYPKPTNGIPVLVLKLKKPNQSDPDTYIVYYVAPLTDSRPKWLIGQSGDIALYRFGPPFDRSGNGDYDATKINDTSTWGNPVVLMDSLSPDALTTNSDAVTAKTNCASPKTFLVAKNASNQELEGFYACVDESKRLAQLNAVAQAKPTKLADEAQPIEYKVSTQVFVRSGG